MENGGHAACAGVAVSVGVAGAGGVGKTGVFVGTAKVAAGAVRVTVFSGDELQATIETVNKTKPSSLNGISFISISMLGEMIITAVRFYPHSTLFLPFTKHHGLQIDLGPSILLSDKRMRQSVFYGRCRNGGSVKRSTAGTSAHRPWHC
jgi:hypothetical protein